MRHLTPLQEPTTYHLLLKTTTLNNKTTTMAIQVTLMVSAAAHSNNKLYFINLLNTTGPNGEAKIFESYFEAGLAVRGLSNIAEKLTPMELQGLINLIENKL